MKKYKVSFEVGSPLNPSPTGMEFWKSVVDITVEAKNARSGFRKAEKELEGRMEDADYILYYYYCNEIKEVEE